ncbi:hypothetical protein MAH1_33600 [Sessilibacter sp. MAH1]
MNSLPQQTINGWKLGNFTSQNLPPKQAQTLLLVANDQEPQDIAKDRNCSPRAVYNHLDALHEKTHTRTKMGLIAKCFELGYLKIICLLLCVATTGATVIVDDQTVLLRSARSARITRTASRKREDYA